MMVIRLAHLGFRLTRLKTEAERGLAPPCQGLARDLGWAGLGAGECAVGVEELSPGRAPGAPGPAQLSLCYPGTW